MSFYKVKEQNGIRYLIQDHYDPLYEQKTESLFAQCNGYLGVRAAGGLPVLNGKRGMFVAGFFHSAGPEEVPELVNCPDMTAFHVRIRGRDLSPDGPYLDSFRRELELPTGKLTVEYTFAPEQGKILEVKEERFASMEDSSVYVQKITLRAKKGTFETLDFMVELNGQITNSGVSHFRAVSSRVYHRQIMHLSGKLERETLHVLSLGQMKGEDACQEPLFQLMRRGISAAYSLSLEEGECREYIRCNHVSADSPAESAKGTDADSAASSGKAGTPEGDKERERGKIWQQEVLETAAAKGWETLLEEHRAACLRFYEEAKLKIRGASLRQRVIIDFMLYHLMGMTPWNRGDCSIASKGLTGEGYKGHVFWDTEIFLMPFFTAVFPEQARCLLDYRYRGLEGARKKAEEFGYKGAMYPWETATDGMEVTPKFAALNIHTGEANPVWSGLKEHHVAADISYALACYYNVTGDQEFMVRCGYEMVFDIADFWVSRAVWQEERQAYGILDIIGPDEYTEHIDNNAYTNHMARYCVELAVHYAGKAKEEAPQVYASMHIGEKLPGWKRFCELLYLPRPNEHGIIPQDDTFLEKPELPDISRYKYAPERQTILRDYSRAQIVNMQVLKQADTVMLLNLFPHLYAPEVVRENVLFYEGKTIHDSSLSYCVHAQACAMVGETELAWDFFEKSMGIDLNDNPYDSGDGIHAAAMGGIWNCIVQGFAGISYQGGTLYVSPNFPGEWEEISVAVHIRGGSVSLKVRRDEVLADVSGKMSAPIQLSAFGQSVLLEKGRIAIGPETREEEK